MGGICRRSNHAESGLREKGRLKFNERDSDAVPESCVKLCKLLQNAGIVREFSQIYYGGSGKIVEKYIPLVRLSVIKEKEIPYAAGTINNPEKVAEFARNILNGADREHLLVLSIDSKCRPLAIEIVSIGTVNATMAEPRETFKHAVLAGAAGIILAHNHPSGDCTPSEEDTIITKRVNEAGKLLGIPLKDHVIVGDGYFSYHENESSDVSNHDGFL